MSWDPHPGLSSQAGSRSATKSMKTGTTLQHNTSPNLEEDYHNQLTRRTCPNSLIIFNGLHIHSLSKSFTMHSFLRILADSGSNNLLEKKEKQRRKYPVMPCTGYN